MLYRVLSPLTSGHVRGDIIPPGRFKEHVVAKLLEVGAIAEVHGPPLAELPGWKRRARILEKSGIVTAIDFMEEDDETLRVIFGYKTTRSVRKWKAEVLAWLRPPDAGGCGCRT